MRANISEEIIASIFRVEDGVSIFLRSAGDHIIDCTVSQLRSAQYEYSRL
jgi:hypothetical protein